MLFDYYKFNQPLNKNNLIKKAHSFGKIRAQKNDFC